VQDRKWIKKASLFEPQASFEAFPFFVLLNWEAEGQWQRGRLFWVTFFGETKKVTGCRATPDLRTMSLREINAKDRCTVTYLQEVDQTIYMILAVNGGLRYR
jgi:hypothetical protein